MKKTIRCTWPGDDSQMIAYHDTEWGVPCHDDAKLFEYVVLDTFQEVYHRHRMSVVKTKLWHKRVARP